MRYVIFVFVLMLLLTTSCGDMSTPKMQKDNAKQLVNSGCNMTCLESCPHLSSRDTLVVIVEALNIEVLETCFNLNYVPVKLK